MHTEVIGVQTMCTYLMQVQALAYCTWPWVVGVAGEGRVGDCNTSGPGRGREGGGVGHGRAVGGGAGMAEGVWLLEGGSSTGVGNGSVLLVSAGWGSGWYVSIWSVL